MSYSPTPPPPPIPERSALRNPPCIITPPQRPSSPQELHSSYYDDRGNGDHRHQALGSADHRQRGPVHDPPPPGLPAQRARSCPPSGVSSTDVTLVPCSNNPPHPSRPSSSAGFSSGCSSAETLADREEGVAAYRPGGFHPVRLRDVFHGRYQVIRKLGYGHYSTVWMVRDMTTTQQRQHGGQRRPEDANPGYYAMKVLAAECYDSAHPVCEREILQHLRDANPHHVGYGSVCHLVDDFEHDGPNGRHVCLVFELMGETLQSYNQWFRDDRIPCDLVKSICEQLLLALWYAHAHGVIHTDIKPDNIFLRIQDWSLIETCYLADTPEETIPHDMPYHPLRSAPLQNYYFAQLDMLRPHVALGDWGIATWADSHLTERIQPLALQAPEVLLRAEWDHRVDLWNLGAVVLELLANRHMFYPYDGPTYRRRHLVPEHLHQITRFFGPIPPSLMLRGDRAKVRRWLREDGTVRKVKGHDWITVHALDDDLWLGSDEWFPRGQRPLFVDFLRSMMKIEPWERATVGDLYFHPWLAKE